MNDLYTEHETATVRRELNRLLSHELFKRGDHRRLLEHIVSRLLEGDTNLVEKNIATDLFKIDLRINPENPRVRLTAGRMRGKIGEYYQQLEGKPEVTITVPKGAYVPVLIWPQRELTGTDDFNASSDLDALSTLNNGASPAIPVHGFRTNGALPVSALGGDDGREQVPDDRGRANTASPNDVWPQPPDHVPSVNQTLRNHLDALINSIPPATKRLPSIATRPGEEWEVIDRWNAFPQVPSFEEANGAINLRKAFKRIGGTMGFVAVLVWAMIHAKATADWTVTLQEIILGGAFFFAVGYTASIWLFEHLVKPKSKVWNWHSFVDTHWTNDSFQGSSVLDPHQLFWHPHQPYLFASRSYYNLNGWKWEFERSRAEKYYSASPTSQDQALFSVGKFEKIFFSDYGFLAESHAITGDRQFAEERWMSYEADGGVRSEIAHHGSADGLFGHRPCNPFRPRRWGREILFCASKDAFTLCETSKLPAFLSFRTEGELSMLRELGRKTVSLSAVRYSDEESVATFAWHPGGIYLAVEVSGIVSVIVADSGELVLKIPSDGKKFEAVGWSPDGLLLALDRNVSQIWDVRTGTRRSTTPDERWRIRDEGDIENKLTSCDGLRSFHGGQNKPKYARWGLEFPESPSDRLNQELGDVTDVAWSPNDPTMFATIGGNDCPRDIRIWRLKA